MWGTIITTTAIGVLHALHSQPSSSQHSLTCWRMVSNRDACRRDISLEILNIKCASRKYLRDTTIMCCIGSCLDKRPAALSCLQTYNYRKTSNISGTLLSNEIVDHSDVIGASPAGAAPTESLFSNLDWNISVQKYTTEMENRNINRYHYGDVIMGATSQITSLTIVCSIVNSGADQRKHQSSAGLWAGKSSVTGEFPALMASNTEKFPFDDVIMS